MINTKLVLLSPDAKVPTYADPGSIGADIYSSNIDTVILPGKRKLIETGLALSVDWQEPDFYLRIAPRSGLSVKGIDVGAGVVDLSYRGQIKVLLINNSDEPFIVNKGDRIAQMILEHAGTLNFKVVSELDSTERGIKGFGASGK